MGIGPGEQTEIHTVRFPIGLEKPRRFIGRDRRSRSCIRIGLAVAFQQTRGTDLDLDPVIGNAAGGVDIIKFIHQVTQAVITRRGIGRNHLPAARTPVICDRTPPVEVPAIGTSLFLMTKHNMIISLSERCGAGIRGKAAG